MNSRMVLPNEVVPHMVFAGRGRSRLQKEGGDTGAGRKDQGPKDARGQK